MREHVARLQAVEQALSAGGLARSQSVRDAGYTASLVVDGTIYVTYRTGGERTDLTEGTRRLMAAETALLRCGIASAREIQMGVAQLAIR